MDNPLQLDRRQVRRAFGRAAAAYDAAAVLQSTVRAELVSRLDLVKLEPSVVVDLGTGTGLGALDLKRRYRRSQVIAADLAEGMLHEATRRQTFWRRFDRVALDAASLPFRDASVDLIFSNLMLQWCNDPDAVFRECQRVLKPGGLLTFTTLGPDTLVELRRAWAEADAAAAGGGAAPSESAHVSRFLDMHDIGDALVRARLAEPVMDVERYTLTYGDARDLMRDLKTIGASNASSSRARGLTGKRTLARMLAAYERFRRPSDGKLPATYEVIYGQAWGTAERERSRTAGEIRVPIASLRRRDQAR